IEFGQRRSAWDGIHHSAKAQKQGFKLRCSRAVVFLIEKRCYLTPNDRDFIAQLSQRALFCLDTLCCLSDLTGLFQQGCKGKTKSQLHDPFRVLMSIAFACRTVLAQDDPCLDECGKMPTQG